MLWGRFYCGRVCAYGAFTQLMDAVLPRGVARRRAEGARGARRLDQVRHPGRGARLLRGDAQHDGLPLRRAVLDVRPLRDVAAAVGRCSACCSWRPCSCATSTAASCARSARRSGVISLAHGLQDQALVGVHDLPHLREDLRVGRDPGPADHLVTECVRCDDCERLYADRPSARTGGSSTTRSVRAGRSPLRPSGARGSGLGTGRQVTLARRVPRREADRGAVARGSARSQSQSPAPSPVPTASAACVIDSRPRRPLETSTRLSAVTITASTSGRRSMSAMPRSGPRMKTPVDRPVGQRRAWR